MAEWLLSPVNLNPANIRDKNNLHFQEVTVKRDESAAAMWMCWSANISVIWPKSLLWLHNALLLRIGSSCREVLELLGWRGVSVAQPTEIVCFLWSPLSIKLVKCGKSVHQKTQLRIICIFKNIIHFFTIRSESKKKKKKNPAKVQIPSIT